MLNVDKHFVSIKIHGRSLSIWVSWTDIPHVPRQSATSTRSRRDRARRVIGEAKPLCCLVFSDGAPWCGERHLTCDGQLTDGRVVM